MYFTLESGRGSTTSEYKVSSESLPSLSQCCIFLSSPVSFHRLNSHTHTRSLQKLKPSWPQFYKKTKDFCRNSKELKYFFRSHWEMGTMRSKDFAEVKEISDLRFMDMWPRTLWFLHLYQAARMLLSGLWTDRHSQAPGLSNALGVWKQDIGNGLQVTRTPLTKMICVVRYILPSKTFQIPFVTITFTTWVETCC